MANWLNQLQSLLGKAVLLPPRLRIRDWANF